MTTLREVPAPVAPDAVRLVGAASCAVAGVLHLAVVPEHLDASLLLGAFFLLVGCGQLVLTAVLVVEPPGPAPLAVVAIVHVGLVLLYVASRTVDLPFAPVHRAGVHVDLTEAAAAAPGGVGNGVPVHRGSRIEPVGLLDAVCVLAEVGLVLAVTTLLRGRMRRLVLDLAVLASVAVGGWVWWWRTSG